MSKRKLFTAVLALASVCAGTAKTYEPVDYVSTLVGSESKHSLSTGNTYPAVAMPWGMNFWTPQTGKMGDGWTYTYSADKLRGFKQTHQPSPWINDYGQFAVMPEVGAPVFDEEKRSRTRQRWLHLITIVPTLPTTMSSPRLHPRSVLPSCALRIPKLSRRAS